MKEQIEMLLRLGREQRANRAWRVAAQTFQKVLALDPKNAVAWNLLGKSLSNMQQFDMGAKAFAKAIKINPRAPEFHTNLGHARRLRGKADKAVKSYKKAIGLDPAFASAYFGLGMLHLEADNAQAAAPLLLEAVKQQPTSAQYNISLADALWGLGKHQQAVKHYQQAIEINPSSASAHARLGNFYEQNDDAEKAERSYRQALTIDPAYPEGVRSLGRILLLQKRYNNVLTMVEHALAKDETNADALVLKCVALTGNGADMTEVFNLMDFANLLVSFELSNLGAYQSLTAFNDALVKHILSHPSLDSDSAVDVSRYGRRTGDLLMPPKGPMGVLELEINRGIQEYLAVSGMDSVLIGKKSDQPWSLKIHADILEEVGPQEPEYHSDTWLSGYYFLRLPTLIESSQKHAGWLEFGRPPKTWLESDRFPTHLQQPREGHLVMFPSYFFHETLPFESDLERIVVSFQVFLQD